MKEGRTRRTGVLRQRVFGRVGGSLLEMRAGVGPGVESGHLVALCARVDRGLWRRRRQRGGNWCGLVVDVGVGVGVERVGVDAVARRPRHFVLLLEAAARVGEPRAHLCERHLRDDGQPARARTAVCRTAPGAQNQLLLIVGSTSVLSCTMNIYSMVMCSAYMIFSPFVGYGFLMCSWSQALSVDVVSFVAFLRRVAARSRPAPAPPIPYAYGE